MMFFCQYFVEALQKVTKLFVYPGTAFMLKLNTLLLKADQLEVRDRERVYLIIEIQENKLYYNSSICIF